MLNALLAHETLHVITTDLNEASDGSGSASGIGMLTPVSAHGAPPRSIAPKAAAVSKKPAPGNSAWPCTR